MKNLTEMFSQYNTIQDQINEDRIDEGLKDLFNTAKEKFKKLVKRVVAYIKHVCVQAGTYFIPVDDKGELMSAISPLTMGQAMKEGKIKKNSTFVHLDKEGAKITGHKTNLRDALKLYGKFGQDAIAYWEFCASKFEGANGEDANINEVKLASEDPAAKYNKILNNEELKDEIAYHIEEPSARLMIWGAPGIGKTAILMNVLEEMKDRFPDYRLIVKTLSNETPDNFTLPAYVEINGEQRATDIPKTWLPVYKPTGDPAQDAKASEACGQGLLFIDELSRATPQVLNVVLPLVNEGIFNGFKLGDGWTIIVASNREEDETSGQTNIGNALSNRFAQVYYEPTVDTWREWADKQGFMSPLLTQWLSMKDKEEFSGGKFYYYDPNEEYDGESTTHLMCTPRSWTNAMRNLASYNRTLKGNLQGFAILDIPRATLQRVLNKYVPAQAIDSFCSFLDIIARIGNFDAAVESVWSNGGKGLNIDKKDLAKIALPLSQLIVSSKGGELPTQKEFDSLCTWLVSTGNDRLTSYVLDVFKNVYCGTLSDRNKDYIFVAAKTYGRLDDNAKENFDLNLKAFLTKWGFKNAGELPDYSTGLALIRDKYKEIFKSSVINGKSGLG